MGAASDRLWLYSVHHPLGAVVLAFHLLLVCRSWQSVSAQPAQTAQAAQQPVTVGMNYGRVSYELLKASIGVDVMRKNGIKKVKLFNADPRVLQAMAKAGSFDDVMVTLPNENLSAVANSLDEAENWVEHNVARYVNPNLLLISCIAVGNEPFLDGLKDLVHPALENIVAALANKGLSNRVKVTVPLNADVVNNTNSPSEGEFKEESWIREICEVLQRTGSYLTVNINPFYMYKDNPATPLSLVMFQGVEAGGYKSLLDKAYDATIVALGKINFSRMKVVLGEVGWPTDGHRLATREMARQFNQACINHLLSAKGTVLRPNQQIDAYMFALFDEDARSIYPGPFERHWGIYDYAGRPKYNLDFTGRGIETLLQMSRTPEFQDKRWCIGPKPYELPDPNATRDKLESTLCPKDQMNMTIRSDCSLTAENASCYFGGDVRKILNVWMNNRYQLSGQDESTCELDGIKGQIVKADPTEGNCSFRLALAPSMLDSSATGWSRHGSLVILGIALIWFVLTT